MRLRAPSFARKSAACVILANAVVRAPSARAAELPGARLEVTRAIGAETCPDADVLAAELSRRVATGNAPARPLVLGVDISRDGEFYVAAIHVQGRKQGERLLRAEGVACDALHDALVVTLLVLLDEERAALAGAPGAATEMPPDHPPPSALATVPPPEISPAPREPSLGAEPETPASSRAPKSHMLPSLWLAAGGGVTHGIPHGWSGALLFDLAVRLGAFEVSAGGFWAPSRTIPAVLGTVDVSAWGERGRGCYGFELPRARGTRLVGCATGMLANLTGNPTSVFQGAHPVSRSWWLAGGSAEATYPLSTRINIGISVSVLATLNPESFSVTGLPKPRVFVTDDVVEIAAARLEARLF